MSDKYKMQEIAEKCFLWHSDDDVYRIDDSFGEAAELSPAEFNRLALEAPIVKRTVSKLAQLDNFYPNDEELEQLLEEIAELEGSEK